MNGARCQVPVEIVAAKGGEENEGVERSMIVAEMEDLIGLPRHCDGANGDVDRREEEEVEEAADHGV